MYYKVFHRCLPYNTCIYVNYSSPNVNKKYIDLYTCEAYIYTIYYIVYISTSYLILVVNGRVYIDLNFYCLNIDSNSYALYPIFALCIRLYTEILYIFTSVASQLYILVTVQEDYPVPGLLWLSVTRI